MKPTYVLLLAVTAAFIMGTVISARHHVLPAQVAAETQQSGQDAQNQSDYVSKKTVKKKPKTVKKTVVQTPPQPKPAAPPVQTAGCSSNASAQKVVVSISQRRMWGCEGSSQVYTAAVITGMEKLAADLTPRGTFYIYGKSTNLNLKGSDSTGSWDDFVYYWMPFLSNQYGVYGFHDATWRKNSEFGNVSPYTSDASHGCVELPLAAAKWLYNWAPAGTTVVIIS